MLIPFRGLAALIFIALFSPSVSAGFLVKDDVVNNEKFTDQVNALGEELYEKTGISLYLVMVRDLDANQSIADFESGIMEHLQQPAVLLTFAELPKKIEIFARPQSLYKTFDKKQVLSPNTTLAEALLSALLFARSWDEFTELTSHYGGTILPILGQKAKGDDIVKKYSVAMYNGYSDIAAQIAKAHQVNLSISSGSGSQIVFTILRLAFYGIILFAVIKYIRIMMARRAKR